MHALSLFSNCGAGDVGYQQAGFQFDLLAEIDERRLEVALQNITHAVGVPGDLRETWEPLIIDYYKEHGLRRPFLMSACPPCQGMSTARPMKELDTDADAGSRDERNLLVCVIDKVARALRPALIVVENVPQFLTKKVRDPQTKSPISAARLLISLLNDNYLVFPLLTDLADFGVPQRRRRAFLTFIAKELPCAQSLIEKGRAPYPEPRETTLDLRLGATLESFDLPKLDSRSHETAAAEGYQDLHRVPVWGSRQWKMVAAIPPNTGRSAWQNVECEGGHKFDEIGDDLAVCPSCGQPLLRPVVRTQDGKIRLVKGFRRSSYRRMNPNEPAATITTASGRVSSDITIHPSENRVLSLIECAKLQTLPDSFQWGSAVEKFGEGPVREMIGEAVPPLFTELHGRALLQVVNGEIGDKLISLSDKRVCVAARKLELPDYGTMSFDPRKCLLEDPRCLQGAGH